MTQKRATLTGLIAILLWSAIVGLIRSVSEGFGAVGGAAMIYTLSALLLLFTVGFPRINTFPRAYLLIGSLLFVSYELCLSLSLGFANTHTQAIEVGMVNYLWPAITVVLSIVVNRQKFSLLIIPGVLLAIAGICRVLGGEQAFSFSQIAENLHSNPLSYGLAFSGAVIWAIYCVVTRRIAQGSNGITLFFILTAVTLWIKFLSAPQPEFALSSTVIINLLLAACAMGFGYAAWNTGILHGNVMVLATACYFIPVISSLLSAFILDSTLTLSFWQGAAMVSLGSLLCWWSTRTTKPAKLAREA
ncbi:MULTISPECIES: aromatic amino acid DMT transporter YddG [Winslowiella]|uniref:aromatic amino acid DMT transporter YddG n=1 Tax=Winslowiella TaxID=2997349 RepID=UPI0028BDE179|nr:aromatic amino acid DMT transporter YddG [Winslowiella toletana]WNN42442.1 aromatic amino acid DMT transporter YddG [Winslowiella toletana]